MKLFHIMVTIALCVVAAISSLNPSRCGAQSRHPQMSNTSDGKGNQLPPPQPTAENELACNNPQCSSCQAAARNSAQSSAAYQRAMNHARAGCPLLLSKHAAHTYDDSYRGYYVGGGVSPGRKACRGESRYCDEGTWGLDYAPWYSRVALNWSHGRLFQGGTGQYEPDRKNRPFGQTYGEHFGNRDRRFTDQSD